MKRVFTLAVGIGLGAAAVILVARGLRRARASVPPAIAAEARRAVDSVRTTFREAVEEGRRAARETEAELRSLVAPSTPEE